MSQFNNVKNRFLPLPQSAAKGLEHEPTMKDFTVIKELGHGSFGNVYLVSHKVTKAQYAIKAIDKKNKTNIEEKPYFRREVEVMYKIHHPNVVKLYGHFEDNNFCYFIMEYISKGNIYSLISNYRVKPIAPYLVASIIKDVICSVYFLHHMNPIIIHRDIKPENVLLTESNIAKLTDFGWSNYMQEDEVRTTMCGTPIYLAPEIIRECGHDERVDIWCIGVLLFELSTGNAPFPGNDIKTLKNNILKLKINWPVQINPEAKDLIEKILRLDPKERITLREMLAHPFITRYIPNAQSYLIKPDDKIDYKTFVVSKDDPKNWDPVNRGNNNNNYSSSNRNGRTNSAGRKGTSSSGREAGGLVRKNSFNSGNDVEELKRLIKEKDDRIEKLMKISNAQAYAEELKRKCDVLEKENNGLRDKVGSYEKSIKESHGQYVDSKLKEIRESIGNNKDDEYSRALENLKSHLDNDTRKKLNDAIWAKDKEIEKLKEEEKAKRNAEKTRFAALINKYDKTLSWVEKENKEIRDKIRDLEAKMNK